MAQITWTETAEPGKWNGALNGVNWFHVRPMGFANYYSIDSSFPRSNDTNGYGAMTSAQEAKDVCQAIVDEFVGLLPVLTA